MTSYTPTAIGHRIATQDNAATATPVFVVEQMRRVFGVSDDYTEKWVWIGEEGEISDTDPTDDPDLDFPGYYRKTGVTETYEFVTACFTREGAKEYIRRNLHNLNQPRIYVYSGNDNPEWIGARDMLILARHGTQEIPF